MPARPVSAPTASWRKSAPLYRFKTAEAVKMANDTEFGLVAYFYSRDIGRIWRVAEGLEYGIVGISEGIISTEIHAVWRHEGKLAAGERCLEFVSIVSRHIPSKYLYRCSRA
jgi:aldehyde dehydrogenase family protein